MSHVPIPDTAERQEPHPASYVVAVIISCGNCEKTSSSQEPKIVKAALRGTGLYGNCSHCEVRHEATPIPRSVRVVPQPEGNRHQRRAAEAERRSAGGIIIP